MTVIQPQQFGCGLVQAPFVTSSGILTKAWSVISSRDERIVGNRLVWKVYEEQDLMVVAFEVQPDFDLKPDLVSSSHLKEDNFPHFEFLCNKKFPVFSVNSSAVLLFHENLVGLDELKARIISSASPRLIVTGLGLGGPIASLFTLSLLDRIGSGKKRPLCITFGSPLIGDKKLQEAISRSSTWSSCFLHVVSYTDPLPKKLKPDTSAYMPFGTFLFCSDISCTCFENPMSVLELLLCSINYSNKRFQPIEYGNIAEDFYHKVICKDFIPRVQDLTNSNSLRASISLQLCAALGLTPDIQQQQQNFDLNTLVRKMETLENQFIQQKKIKFDASKKLNALKIDMAKLEWYKKVSKNQHIGYYDIHKRRALTSDEDVITFQKNLTNYWKDMVAAAEMKPQREGAAFRVRWLYAGTNYRRMVKPLDIADYYRNGGKDYVNHGRSEHYKVLERWLEEDKINKPNVELLLTSDMEDICELSFEENWDFCTSVVDNCIHSYQGSMVVAEWEDNSMLNITSDDGNEEAISLTMCSSYWSRINQLLLSSKELNVMGENEENLNTSSKNNDNKYSSFEACVDVSLISCKGSVKEENIKKFESRVDETLLSRLGSMSIAVKELDEIINRTKKKNMEHLLTFDSCFWAHVEEALLLCKELKIIKEKEETLRKLVEFEEYVYGLLKNYEVSPEIFLKESSYMRWWNLYKAIKGTSYNSALASFMNDVRNYDQYALGDYYFF